MKIKKVCPTCKRNILLTKDNRFQRHPSQREKGKLCPRSGSDLFELSPQMMVPERIKCIPEDAKLFELLEEERMRLCIEVEHIDGLHAYAIARQYGIPTEAVSKVIESMREEAQRQQRNREI